MVRFADDLCCVFCHNRGRLTGNRTKILQRFPEIQHHASSKLTS